MSVFPSSQRIFPRKTIARGSNKTPVDCNQSESFLSEILPRPAPPLTIAAFRLDFFFFQIKPFRQTPEMAEAVENRLESLKFSEAMIYRDFSTISDKTTRYSK